MGVLYWSPSLSYASCGPAAGGGERSAQTLYPRSKESRGYPQPMGATAQGSKAFRLSWASQRVSRRHVASGSAYSAKLNQDPPAPKSTFRCPITITQFSPVRTGKKIPLSAELPSCPYPRPLATGSTLSALLSLPHVGPSSKGTLTPPRHPSEGSTQAPNVEPLLYLLATLLVRPRNKRLGDLLVSLAMRRC